VTELKLTQELTLQEVSYIYSRVRYSQFTWSNHWESWRIV